MPRFLVAIVAVTATTDTTNSSMTTPVLGLGLVSRVVGACTGKGGGRSIVVLLLLLLLFQMVFL